MSDYSPLFRAVTAVRNILTDTPPDADTRRAANDAVTAAVTGVDPVSPDEIASRAGVSPLLVISLIGDRAARAEALRQERESAEIYASEVLAMIRREAWIRWDQGGQRKRDIATELGITRRTLDAWLD